MIFFLSRKRATADQCLNHAWLQQLDSRTRKSSLNATKQNLSTHKEHWEEQGNHDYVFDRPSKTISIAANSPTPNPAEQQDPQPDVIPEEPHPLPPEDVHPQEQEPFVVDHEEAPMELSGGGGGVAADLPPAPHAASVMLSPSSDSIRSQSPSVITLDQIKQKAEEICERKNSTCSTQINEDDMERLKKLGEAEPEAEGDSSEWEWEDDEDEEEEKLTTPTFKSLEEEEEDQDDRTVPTPLQLLEENNSSNDEGVGSPGRLRSSDIFITEYSEPSTPKAAKISVFDHKSDNSSSLLSCTLQHQLAAAAQTADIDSSSNKEKTANNICLEIEGQPLWLAAERTVTPLYELANSTLPSSTDVSKSNSELSVRNFVNSSKNFLMEKAKSILSSDQSCGGTTTDEDQRSVQSTSKESSVDLHYQAEVQVANCSNRNAFPLPESKCRSSPVPGKKICTLSFEYYRSFLLGICQISDI